MKRLKTTTADDIYNIEIVECEEVNDVNESNFSECICFLDADEHKYIKLIKKVQERMKMHWETKWKDKDFIPGKYWYVTTSYPSYIRNLHVIDLSQKIAKEEDTNTQRYNYFQTKEEADELQTIIETVFDECGIFLFSLLLQCPAAKLNPLLVPSLR